METSGDDEGSFEGMRVGKSRLRKAKSLFFTASTSDSLRALSEAEYQLSEWPLKSPMKTASPSA